MRPNGSVTTYQYNGLNQLTEISNTNSSAEVLNQHVFTYNNQDLRGSETITGSALPAMPALPEETRDYDYNAVNQLLSVTNPNLTFVYDDDGNMTHGYVHPLLGGAGVGFPFTATYDAEDQMTSLEYTDSSSVVHRTEYRYSGDGFLAEIRKYENSALVETVRVVRDGFLAIQDRDGSNNVVREYTWGLNLGGGIGGLLNLKQGGQDYAYLYDGKGNVAAVIDSSQAVVAAYRYAPFGKLLAKTGSLTQPFGFSTKQYDAQTGLIYYGYRFYGPAIGRWTTRDPLGEAGGMNLYAFVGNNPVNWVDPWGLRIRAPIDIDALIKHNQEVKSALDFLPNFLLDMFYPTSPEGIESALTDQILGFACPISTGGGGFKHAWIKKDLYKKLPKLVGEATVKKFKAALKKGLVGPIGESGVKILREPVLGYTHELKIGGSAQRLLGKINEKGVLVFEKFVRGGLH